MVESLIKSLRTPKQQTPSKGRFHEQQSIPTTNEYFFFVRKGDSMNNREILREKTDEWEISPEGSGRRDDDVNERDVPLFSSI